VFQPKSTLNVSPADALSAERFAELPAVPLGLAVAAGPTKPRVSWREQPSATAALE
jgi:hypothetical protein